MLSPKVLGIRIKYFRKRAGFSQLKLETSIGASSGMVSRIENGTVNPTKETVQKIAKVLKLNDREVNYLIGDIAFPVNKEEISRAVDVLNSLFHQDGNISYLTDDRWRILYASDGFKKLLGAGPELSQKVIGHTLIELLLNDDLGIKDLFDSSSYQNLLKTQLMAFYYENGFMEDDEICGPIIQTIKNDNELEKLWFMFKRKWHSNTYHSQDERIVKFNLGGRVVACRYSREPILNFPRFEISEYTLIK